MAADRKRLAREAMALVAGQNEAATSIPAPSQGGAKSAMKTSAKVCGGAVERKRPVIS